MFLAIAIAASTASVVAPAAAAGVSGTLSVELQESVDSSHKVANKQVQLWDASDNVLEAGVTGLDGVVEFVTVLDGLENYSIYVEQGDPYQDVVVDNVIAVTANAMTINLVPVAGTITGTISNWDASLAGPLSSGDGTSVNLWRYDSLDDEWDSIITGQLIFADWYRIAGVYDTEPYLASILPYEPADFFHTTSDGAPVSLFFGVATATGMAGNPAGNTNAGSMALIEAGYVSGNISARDGSHPESLVYVASDVPDFSTPAVLELGVTDPDGDYTVKVPVGYDYLVLAQDFDGDYYQLIWDDYLPRFCSCDFDYDVVNVSAGATTTGVDFVFTPIDTSVLFDLYLSELDQSNLPDELALADVKVHLYKPITGGWQEVDARESSTYGYSYVAGSTTGTYRIRFSVGSDWLPFTRYTDDDDVDHTVAASCYLDVTNTELGDDLLYDFLIDTEASSPACGPEATVGTTTKASGNKRTRTTAEPAVVMPTPSATPTPEPTESASPTEPTPTPTPTLEPQGSAPDFTWLIWLLVVIALIILGCLGFVAFRRR